MYSCSMDFGKIYRQWEEQQSPRKKPSTSKRIPKGAPQGDKSRDDSEAFRQKLEQWLEDHGTTDKDAAMKRAAAEDKMATISAYTRFKRMLPRAELDLHGMREAEARQTLRAFIARCAAQGLEKVSIIHGKGNHSREEQVLVHVVREELERNPHAGEFDFADSRHGGKGATWVRIRQSISRGK
jgi:DNA-nicking Smr family endonuclease